MRVEADGTLGGPIAKNFEAALQGEFMQRMGAEVGDVLLFIADIWEFPAVGGLGGLA